MGIFHCPPTSSDRDFTRLAARPRGSGLTAYGFGKRKTPQPFVAACDKFLYTNNLTSPSTASSAGAAPKQKPGMSTAQLTTDAALANQRVPQPAPGSVKRAV
ncbi:hypothetical protein SAMN05421854_106423 [Amycolatopsis rubida]|uniref:NYN domain-containing protein n=2 Tax=Amycolatopsis rubida TaxID=112413 RepID=A0A1I5SRI7_9PSEU|nr:hypothetical protein SAMN05421854_106423 [Amycolatopsis rubida]